MKISKSIRAKIFVLVAFLVLMFVQVGPYILYADENELTFSYRKLSMIATNWGLPGNCRKAWCWISSSIKHLRCYCSRLGFCFITFGRISKRAATRSGVEKWSKSRLHLRNSP